MLSLEIIPKFASLLHRKRPVVLHGDGSPTRRYLFAGDACDALDTILHKGEIGQTYNVGSTDEVSNIQLCHKLLDIMGIDSNDEAVFKKWVKYTHDRPFNDHRYAVDATKLRNLGWTQRTAFEDGLRLTVDWYKQFGNKWWGNIEPALSPFPTVNEKIIRPDEEPVIDSASLERLR